MSEKQWDKKVADFIKQAGDELKRTGEQLKTEAQKLLVEIKDPANQQKMREKLNELGTWAKKTVEEAGQMVEVAKKKAEEAFRSGWDTSSTESTSQAPVGDASSDVGSVPPPIDESPAERVKTMGRKAAKTAAKGVKQAAKTAKRAAKSAAKTIGKKRR